MKEPLLIHKFSNEGFVWGFFWKFGLLWMGKSFKNHYFINACICQELFAVELEERRKTNPLPWSTHANPRPKQHKGTEQSPAPGKASLTIEGFVTELVGCLSPQVLQQHKGKCCGLVFHFAFFFFKQIINQLKPNGISWDVKAFLSLTAFSSLNSRPAAKNMFFKSSHQK